MLKKLLVSSFAIFMIFLLGSKPVFAQEKIAVVSLQKALNDVEEGKRIKANLKKEYDLKKKQIDSLKAELDKMSQDIEKQKLVLSQDALKAKSAEMQTKFIDLQNKAAEYERELKTKEAESAKKIVLAMRAVISGIAQKDGYTLVLENSAETVLYTKNGTDITAAVIAAYNSGK